MSVTTRTPAIQFVRLHAWPPGLHYGVFWNGQRATNGDGIPGAPAAPVDYSTPLFGPTKVWADGQAIMFGGGFGRGAFGVNGSNGKRGLGFGSGGFGIGEFGRGGGVVTWRFPWPLRNGDYVVGIQFEDAIGNVDASPIEVSFTVLAIPRPASRVRALSWSAGTGLSVEWDESPDLA